MKATLCERTLENACKAYPMLRGAVIHSDKDTQYTSKCYRRAVNNYGILQTEVQNNFARFLKMVQEEQEIVIIKNGSEIARLISKAQTVSFLSDILVGVLSSDVDEKKARAERIARYEMDIAKRQNKSLSIFHAQKRKTEEEIYDLEIISSV